MQTLINQSLDSMSALISANLWAAPFLALIAGVLTAFTPCALSSIPLVIGYVGGVGGDEPRTAFRLSLVFALGMTVTFAALGTAASLLGRLFQGSGSWWYILLGILMVLMALQTWGLFDFIPSTHAVNRNKKRGYTGAFLSGILGGFFSSPCATPVLIVLLAFVANEGSLFLGVLMLLVYAAGHSVLVLAAGTSVGFVQKISLNNAYGTLSTVLKIGMGAMILLLAFYMFYLGF